MSDTKSVQIVLDVDLWRRVRAEALLRGLSAQQAATAALMAWVVQADLARGEPVLDLSQVDPNPTVTRLREMQAAAPSTGSDAVEKNAAIVPRRARAKRIAEMNDLTRTVVARGGVPPVTEPLPSGRYAAGAPVHPEDVQTPCRCGHLAAAHVHGTGRCQFGTGCAQACRTFVQADGDF